MSAEAVTKPIKTIRKKIAKTVDSNPAAAQSVRQNNENTHETVKEQKVKKTKEVKVEPTTGLEVSVETEASESSSTETESFRARLDVIIKGNSDRISELKSQNSTLKKLQKDHEVELKLAGKKKKKVVDPNAPKRKPTGFAAPRRVTPELHEFLKKYDVGENDLVSGTSVSSYMHKYLKSENLVDPDHNKEFIPDAALKKLLAPSDSRREKDDPNSPLVYKSFEIQKYIKHHFIKNDESVVA
jgi:hypothetical protein